MLVLAHSMWPRDNPMNLLVIVHVRLVSSTLLPWSDMVFATRTQRVRVAIAVATWLSVCLSRHVDVLSPNDRFDHHRMVEW